MSVLLLRLEAPMQSWGINAKFTERPTELEPTKSGVIGLLCSALGRSRNEDLQDLVSLKMATRVDREGKVTYDYHTTLDVLRASGTHPTKSSLGNVVSRRYYLADACFLVGLESNEEDLLKNILYSLKKPKWPLYLGRKSFLPSTPISIESKLLQQPLMEVMRTYPWLGRESKNIPNTVRLVYETDPSEGEPKLDVPISFKNREFQIRYITTTFIPIKSMKEENNLVYE